MAIKFYGGHQLNSKAKVYGTRQDFEVVEVDENGDPITEPSYMPENTNDGSTNWNTIGSNLPDTRNATELTWNLDNSVAPLTAFGTAGWMFQKVSEPSIQLGNSYIVSLKVLNATSDLTVRVVKGNTEYGYTPSMVTSLAEQTIPAGDYTNSPQLVSLTVDLPTSIGSWTNTLMIQFASAAGYGTFSIQDVLLTDGAPAASSLLAVTAPYAPNSANNVFVYNLNDMTESPIGLMPFDNDPNVYSQGFGFGITITEKYIVVGSSDDDDNNAYSGSVYVYDKTDLSAQPTKLLAFDGDEYDVFGRDIAYSDGYIFVGANGDDNEFGNASGAVYVYDEDDISAQPIKLTENTNNLGNRISAVNGKLAVSSTSRVFVYDINNLSAQPTIVGDGYIEDIMLTENKLFCGVLNDNGLAGRVDIYDINNLSANPTDIRAPDASSGDKFGSNLAFNNTKLYVSAYHDTDNGSKSGSVYVYNIADLSVQPTKITAPDGSSEDFFGRDIVADDNYVVIGAYGFDLNASNPHPFDGTGAIYVYDANNISAAPVKIIETTGHNDRFGLRMDIGEPVPPVRYYKTLATQYVPPPPVSYLVTRTSWGNDAPQPYSERLYFFEIDNISETPTVTTNPSISADPWGGYGDQYGMKVVSWNNKIIVNASYEDINTNNDDIGVVYIYDASDLSTPETTLHAPYQNASTFFGQDIGVNDTHLFVIEGNTAGRERFFMYDMENLSAGPVEVSVGSLANVPAAPTNSGNHGRWGSIDFVDNDHLVLVNHYFMGTEVHSNGLLVIVDLSDMSQRFITPNDHDTVFNNSQQISVSNDGSKIYLPSTGAYSDIQGYTAGKLHNGNVSVMDFATGSLLYTIDDPNPDSGTSSTYFGQRIIETNDKLIISAPLKQTSGDDDGKIYVYDKAGLSGSSTPSLTLSSPFGINWPTGTYHFGWDMELHGNYLYVSDRSQFGQGINYMSAEERGAYILRYDITDLSAPPYQISEPTIPGISEHIYMFSRDLHIITLPPES